MEERIKALCFTHIGLSDDVSHRSHLLTFETAIARLLLLVVPLLLSCCVYSRLCVRTILPQSGRSKGVARVRFNLLIVRFAQLLQTVKGAAAAAVLSLSGEEWGSTPTCNINNKGRFIHLPASPSSACHPSSFAASGRHPHPLLSNTTSSVRTVARD